MARKLVLALVLAALAAGQAAAGDLDFAVTKVTMTAGSGPGLAEVIAHVSIVVQDSVPGTSTLLTLSLDGSAHASEPVITLPFAAVGCTYYENWMGLGPACVDEPGCDLYSINGLDIPGDCFLVIVWWGPWPIYCACKHDFLVLWHDVPIGDVGVLEVMADADGTVSEPNETNNVYSVSSPVPVETTSWGMIKATYR